MTEMEPYFRRDNDPEPTVEEVIGQVEDDEEPPPSETHPDHDPAIVALADLLLERMGQLRFPMSEERDWQIWQVLWRDVRKEFGGE